MSTSRCLTGLVIAALLQGLVLAGMLAKARLPLWTGQPLQLHTQPVDPRSLLRGNYARLSYDISQLPEDALGETRLRKGDRVYVQLASDDRQVYHYAGASLEKPQDGVFLRGRIQNRYPPYRVNYGIEAFFAPRQQALALEKALRQGGIARVMVSRSGQAALQDVIAGPTGNSR